MSQPKMFAREATGLVRRIGFWDSMFLVFQEITIGLTLIFYALALSTFPGGDGVIAAILCGLAVVPVALSYALMSVAMPRSGGDYVFISRVIHPALGVASTLSYTIWTIFFGGVFTNWAMTVGAATVFQVTGSILNSPTLLALGYAAQQPTNVILVGSIILLGLPFLAARSIQVNVKLQSALMVIGILGVILWAVVLGTTNNGAFISQFNAFSMHYVNDTDYYHTIIRTAQQGGMTASTGFSLAATINLVPLAAYIFPYVSAASIVGGEVKNPGKNFPLGIVGALLLSLVLAVVALWALINAVGVNFLLSIDYVYVNGLSYALPTAPYFTLFAALVTNNLYLQAAMAVSFICWPLSAPVVGYILIPRELLALSFDRVLPAKISSVSRYGTPWVAIIVMAVISEAMLIIYTLYATVLATISGIFGTVMGTFMVATIATALFPFVNRTKSIYEGSPKMVRYKIAGLPFISLVGILGTLFLGWITLMYIVNPAYGASNLVSDVVIVIIYGGGIATYYISKIVRRREGVDLGQTFAQIPPE